MLFSTVEIVETLQTDTEDLLSLFNKSFPNAKYSRSYIEWLYHENPGGEVIGFDMYEKNQLIGHYACIPTNVDRQKGYLSLNTATHPEYQGKGIFRSLAAETLRIVESQNSFVIGVANQNSTATFVKRLKFELLGNLNLRFGKITIPENGSRLWSCEELTWRTRNPRANASVKRIKGNIDIFQSKINGVPFNLKTIVKTNENEINNYITYGFTVDWNRDSSLSVSLPKKLKPSPLALIIKDFSKQQVVVNSWNFADFDAF